MRDANDSAVIDAMLTYGGSFMQHLARACQAADSENLGRIKRAFADEWLNYADLAARTAAKAGSKHYNRDGGR